MQFSSSKHTKIREQGVKTAAKLLRDHIVAYITYNAIRGHTCN